MCEKINPLLSLTKDFIDDPIIIKTYLEWLAYENTIGLGALISGVPAAFIGGWVGMIGSVFALPFIIAFSDQKNIIKNLNKPTYIATVAAGLVTAIPGAAIGVLFSFPRKIQLEKSREIIYSAEKIALCCRLLYQFYIENDFETFKKIKNKIISLYKMPIIEGESKTLFLKLKNEIIPDSKKITALLDYLNEIETLSTRIISIRKNTGKGLFNIIIKTVFEHNKILLTPTLPTSILTNPKKIQRRDELGILIILCAHFKNTKEQFLCFDIVYIIGSFLGIPPCDTIHSDFIETCRLKESYERNLKLLNHSNNSSTLFKPGESRADTLNRLARYAYMVGGSAKLTCDQIENETDQEIVTETNRLMEKTLCEARASFTFEVFTNSTATSVSV